VFPLMENQRKEFMVRTVGGERGSNAPLRAAGAKKGKGRHSSCTSKGKGNSLKREMGRNYSSFPISRDRNGGGEESPVLEKEETTVWVCSFIW